MPLLMLKLISATCRAGIVTTLLCGAALALFSLPANAQWKWRDASGQITVSDRPPPRDVAEKDILQRPAAPAKPSAAAAAAASAPGPSAAGAAAPAPGASAAPVDKELEARKRAADAEKTAKAKAEEDRLNAQRAENCKRARGSLAALESGQRITRFNEKGEREILDDTAKAAETRRAREAILSDCKQP